MTTRAAGFSFCLITDGRRPQQLAEEIATIRALQLPAYEIIVAGRVPFAVDGVRVIDAAHHALVGQLGAMRNLACAAARFDHLIVADDDMRFHLDFANGLRYLVAHGADVDVLCVRLLNPDGTRYWDWATSGGPRGHILLDYRETDPFVYVTGGLAIMKATVHDAVRWDDVRGFYAGEDLDWSSRVRAAGFRIGLCVDATVTHDDARYTRQGHTLRFQQDLALFDRLVPDVEVAGFFRPLEPDTRWMSMDGRIRVEPKAGVARVLRVSVASLAASLAELPLRVVVEVNGAAAGTLVFKGPQSFNLVLPIAPGAPLLVRMQSTHGVRAADVGVPDDERPASILLHDVALDAT
ncbi:glycosyltransferase [Gemmatimonas sp.]|uniref:glycosyltransferase family 2 protein n=1 Tax=Gemmatimonas sp. TaxID=1962908 RepID=UPI00286C2629|nr:glycosyltransferase [Gemmatimonas sp.]